MMRGLLTKTSHEVWRSTLLFGFALMTVKALLTYILPQVQAGFSDIFETMPFVKTLITALLGSEVGDEISARTMQAFLWCILSSCH